VQKQAVIFAHRGVSGDYPENTMAAFEAVLKSGAAGIELDVQLTKDGELAVIHDEQIDRTTDGIGYIKDFSYDQLRRFDAGSWFSSFFEGASIPTLKDVFDWAVIEGNDLTINIELKNDKLPYEGMEEKVLELIERYNLEDRIIISSFNPESLKKVRSLNKTIDIGYLIIGVPEDAVERAKDMGANAIHCQPQFALSSFGQQAIEEGFPLRVYTVNDPNDQTALLEAGVEVIMSDFPERFVNN
jgi:glycerophosphoryl diester phosphodiesterase